MRECEIVGEHVREAELAAFFGQELRLRQYLQNSSITQFTAAFQSSADFTSIVILTHNQLRYTQLCLASLRLFTPEPVEVIVVDNASTDGTVPWLRQQPDVMTIANESNRGFAAGCNQGIVASHGSRILLLNNDVVVTPGWLERLQLALAIAPDIGLAGPVSNFVSGYQQIDAQYQDLRALECFSARLARAHTGEYQSVSRLIGFCLLLRRSLLDQIGLLDEQFEIGMFEDDDLCRRAAAVGVRAVVARDTFVHHFGSATFRCLESDRFKRVYFENRARFVSKWQSVAESAKNGHENLPAADDALEHQSSLTPPDPRPRISLAMIARDNARTIRACLESIRPWVDEMVVVDTGSLDETPEIAASLGARVFHFPWCDDFSAARNEAIRHAAGEWIFWMDSDDTIDDVNGARLRSLVDASVDPTVVGFTVAVHCPGPGPTGDNDVTVVDHVKLFRNRPDIRFDGRIHEQILPAIRRANGRVAWTEAYVVHSGYDHSPSGQIKKIERDLRLLKLELADRPDHPFTLFNLGMTYSNIGQYEQAVDYLMRSIARSQPVESHLRKAYALLVYSWKELGRLDDAWRALEAGLALFPADVELRFRKGVLLQANGRWQEAVRTYEDVLASKAEVGFRSIDSGIGGFKTRFNLALALRDSGDRQGAEVQLRQILVEVPQYPPAVRALGELLLRHPRTEVVVEFAEGLLRDARLESEGLLLLAEVSMRQGDRDATKRHLVAAVASTTADMEPRQRLCRFLFQGGLLDEAKVAMEQLIEHCPDDASAYHNLGTIALHDGHYEEALSRYDRSLGIRFLSPQTHLYRGYTLTGLGRMSDARLAFNQALLLAPDDPESRTAIDRLDARLDPGSPNGASYGIAPLAAYIDAEPDCLLNVGVGQSPHCEAEQFLARWPQCRVVGWEPNPLTFEQRCGDYPGEIRPLGVWNEPGERQFWPTEDQGNSSMLRPLPALQQSLQFHDPITVEVETLDSWFARNGATDVCQPFERAFLWLDIEGAELQALRGAEQLLRSGRIRWVLAEISGGSPRREGEPTPAALDAFLEQFGFVPVGMETLACSLNRVYRLCSSIKESQRILETAVA